MGSQARLQRGRSTRPRATTARESCGLTPGKSRDRAWARGWKIPPFGTAQ